MKVTIRQREEEYTSDYNVGWKFSAGDPFKFPVMIGDTPCFVKRFEQKSPEDISGWDLLVKMIGVDQKNISTVFDIRNEEEDGKQVYYVFYQYLDGITLDKYLRQPGIDINLLHLRNDLFNAIGTLQKYGFWFVDFTEKNIFCQKDGSFVLVDVDSTHRITDLPVNEMYGSKDYWILVLKFYKEILNKSNIRLSDINGINLNYLQIPFLVLRLKMFLGGNREDYNSTAVFNQLPAQLDKMAPDFRDIYLKVIDSGKDPLSPDDIRKIEDLVERKIIKAGYTPVLTAGSARLPVIREFKQSSNEIESGGTFTLSWVVENVNKLELYKNGALFKALDLSQKEVSLKEFADGTRQESSYQLIAYNELNMAKSEQKIIKLRDKSGRGEGGGGDIENGGPKYKWFIIGGVGLLAIALAVFFLTRQPKSEPDGPDVDSAILPIVNAGRDTSIVLPNDKVLLEGTVTDSNNNVITASYSWRKIQGPAAEISSPTQATTMVRQLNQAGTYLFEFKAIADKGGKASDTLTVVVSAAANIAPKADAGDNKRLILPTRKNEVTLSGKRSTDQDGSIVNYEWSKVAGPPGGGVSPATVNEPTATVTGLQIGTYQYKLKVTDNKGTTNESTVLVYVLSTGQTLPDNWKKIRTLDQLRVIRQLPTQ